MKAKFDLGVFLELEYAPEVNGFVDNASYNPSGAGEDTHKQLPNIGELVEGTVVSLDDRDRQIRIRVGAPFWEPDRQAENGP
ncbi:hypothetical protein ACWCXB_02965 [Streptomyces sp. NPDC001514]